MQTYIVQIGDKIFMGNKILIWKKYVNKKIKKEKNNLVMI